MSVPSSPPPPPYDESGKLNPSPQYPGPTGYPGVQPTGCTAQAGLQYETQPSKGFQQGASQFYPQCQPQAEPKGQPQFYPQYQPGYPPPQLYPGGPYPQGSYSGQQPYGQPIPGEPYNTTQVVVSQSVPQQVYVVTATRPTNYILPAILACLCCFCPTGCAAIYYAHEANRMAMSGNMDGANRSSNSARSLIIASVVVGVIFIIVIFVLRFGSLTF